MALTDFSNAFSKTPLPMVPSSKPRNRFLRFLPLPSPKGTRCGAVCRFSRYDRAEAERRFGLAMARNLVSTLVRRVYATNYLLPIGPVIPAIPHAFRELTVMLGTEY
jgi:hypothetical protein